MQALVLGGAGPVGASVCKRLLELENDLFCIDSEIFTPTPIHRRNLKNPRFKYLRADLADIKLESLLNFAPACDVVLNFCGPARFVYYTTNPAATATAQLNSTITALQYCKATGSRFIFASSSEVYGSGKSKDDRMVEDRSSNIRSSSSRAVYASAKLLAESVTTRSGVPWVILRLFNVYGPDYSTDDDRVIPKMISSVDSGHSFTVFGNGSQVRSFVFIEDLVDAVVTILEGSCENEVFNVGNPEPVSIVDLGSTVSKAIGKPFIFRMNGGEPDDIRFRVPSIDKMYRTFGWKPKVRLQVGLERCVNERK